MFGPEESQDHTPPKAPTPPTTAERIRGCTAMFLLLASFTLAANTHDSQLQLSGIVAGFLYMLTTIAIVFKDEPVAYHPR
ncbi:MAG: hypothetical protein KGS72_24960 [Cyanobacteria bacterium REEB67]|nr:hypothetical protein [Cyanobacteria bacterium REEB67]